jgi:xanthine dehydrogenase accessory factor
MMAQMQNHIMPHPDLKKIRICVKGAGDLATGVATRLYAAGLARIVMLEIPLPLSVRRAVSFSEAVYLREKSVEGVLAKRVDHPDQVETVWKEGSIAVMVDPRWRFLKTANIDVVVDAIVAKRNTGSRLTDAPLVIGLGPGFTAGEDVHCIVETQRGHHLGRLIRSGRAAPNSGIPGVIAGFGIERLLRSPVSGIFNTDLVIGDWVSMGQIVGQVTGIPVTARIDGFVRGLLRSGTQVDHGTKLGDIDPRQEISDYRVVSDKARAIGGGVLEAILGTFLPRRNPDNEKPNQLIAHGRERH